MEHEVEAESSEPYVVCRACGARIKASRDRCLRCLQPLHVDESTLPVWKSLKTSDRAGLIAGGIAALVVVGFAFILYTTQETVDTEARPAPNAAVATKASPAPAAVEPTVTAQPAGIGDAEVAATRRDAGTALTNGDVPRSREQFEEALRTKPDDPESLNGLGLALERANDLNGAVARFKRAAELVPDKWSYRFNLAHAEGRLNQLDQAIADYREAIKLSPDDYPTQYNLALLLHKKGDEQAAIVEYQKAITLAPGEPSFYLSLGISLERVGRMADAVKAYKQYLELAPDADDASRVKEHVDLLANDTQKPGRVS